MYVCMYVGERLVLSTYGFERLDNNWLSAALPWPWWYTRAGRQRDFNSSSTYSIGFDIPLSELAVLMASEATGLIRTN